MSALFGHIKGAFTGAVQDRPGLLRAADTGLLFLDEVAELGPDEQAMLLRAVEEKRFLPVGSDREARSDFQLIAGTNRNLQAAVAEGRFREDLLARINLWTFQLPALRGRPEDIEPNLEFELERFARLSGAKVTFNKEARVRFLAFATAPDTAWTGNFRDLNAAVTRMATFAAGGRITVDIVDGEITRLKSSWPLPGGEVLSDDLESVLGAPAHLSLDPFDRTQLAEVVRVCRPAVVYPRQGDSCFPFLAPKRNVRTTRTGCANILRDSAWIGRAYIRATTWTIPRTSNISGSQR